jgi:integrase
MKGYVVVFEGDDEAGYSAYSPDLRGHGDTKTEKSRRSMELPQMAVDALQEWLAQQTDERLEAGTRWQDNHLMFTTVTGTPLDAANVRKMFRAVCRSAGIGDHWTPRGTQAQLRLGHVRGGHGC